MSGTAPECTYIPTYRCGDTVVEAMQWPAGDSYQEVCQRAAIHRWVWANDGHTWVTTPKSDPDDVHVTLETINERVRINDEDWIIRGVLNTFYRCDPETFAVTWELVQ
jgi:hypothetical protein